MPLFENFVLGNPEKRPTAQEIKKELAELYSQFWSPLPIKMSDYINLFGEEKDRLFMIFYDMVADNVLTYTET